MRFGISWERFGDGIDFRLFFAGTTHPFGVPFWHPKSQKSHESTKKTVSRKQCRKNVLPEVDRIGLMCDPYNKYHMFREVKECPFGELLGSAWLPFGVTLDHFLQKVVIRRPKKTHQNKSPKIDEKRSCGTSGQWCVNPKRVEAKRLEATSWRPRDPRLLRLLTFLRI